MNRPSDDTARTDGVRWPTTREESWRYFPTRPLMGFALDAAPADDDLAPPTAVAHPRLVVVGGRYRAAWSSVPAGLVIATRPGPAPHSPLGDGLSVANQRWGEALELTVPDGVALGRLEVLHLAPPMGVAQPRLVVRLGARASLTLLQRFAGGGEGFVNASLEVVLGAGAELEHAKLEVEASGSSHVESVHVAVGADARYRGFTLSLGALRARTAPTVVLAAAGARAAIDGLYLGAGEQVMDHTVVISHEAPHTTSEATWAGVLDDRSTGTFQGLVRMTPAAVRGKTRELTRTLLLSPQATANAKPELHIDVDDVEASHGAAIGTLDPAQLFYLASRGVAPDDARRILIGAFVRATLERAPAAFRAELAAALESRVDFGAEGDAGEDDDGEL